MPRPNGGYSLYELLMSLGLLAIVLGLGVPSLSYFVADKRLRAQADALFHTVHLARQQSITSRRVITLCPSVDGENCDSEHRWAAGWILFANRPGSDEGRRDADEPVVWRHAGSGAPLTIRSNRATYSFRSTERRATNGTITLCDPEDRAPARAVVVSYTGRPRVAYRDSRGRPYRCALG